MWIWQVKELATFFNIQFNAIANAVDGEDAYKKMEQVGMGSILVPLKAFWSSGFYKFSLAPTRSKCKQVEDQLNMENL